MKKGFDLNQIKQPLIGNSVARKKSSKVVEVVIKYE